MVKGKDVPVNTMKIFRGSTVTSAIICNLSKKEK
jgi:predicted aconitase with swiveling domain